MILMLKEYEGKISYFINNTNNIFILIVLFNDIFRAHLNDLENIPIFLIIGLIFVATKPSEMLANNLFRIYTFERMCHTFAYAVFVIPQPLRTVSFFSGLIVHIIIIVYVILNMHHF